MRRFGFSIRITLEGNRIDNYQVNNFFVPKFLDDKIDEDSGDFLIVLDGVILNKKELLLQYKKGTWVDTIIEMYHSIGDTFFNCLRGSFSGVLYSKREHKTIIFSDQIGSKFLYYSQIGDTFFLSSMMEEVYRFREGLSVKNKLSVENAYLLLSYGYMIDDRTICEGVKKIRPGCFLEIKDGQVKERQYYLLENTPNKNISATEWIERIDDSFRCAIKQQFEKDKEYGYKHLVALSAGLDSRMTSWVAHDMGYTDQLNFTFSQTNYYDETIPKQIASDLKHEWLFKSLDNGLWLFNLDEITRLTGGNVLYYGLSHAYSLYSKLNFSEYGMIHTGQLGDAILGTFYKTNDEKEHYQWGDGAYSTYLLDRIGNITYSRYKNVEISKLIFRGFSGANNGNIAEYAFTESFSPFYNLDFLELALSIPLQYRLNHNIYKNWIISKYPAAADYIWEKIGCKITRKMGFIKIGGRLVKLEEMPIKVLKKIIPGKTRSLSNSMNPIDFYINTNKELSCYINTILSDFLYLIEDSDLKNDLIRLYNEDSGVGKIQVISLLSAVARYFK